jgi:quercetin dioxygenase-like cupin family protein
MNGLDRRRIPLTIGLIRQMFEEEPMQRMKTFAVAIGVMLLAGYGAGAQQTTPQKPPAPAAKKPMAVSKHVIVAPDEVKWGPAPPSLPSGSEVAVLEGDPGKAGMFTLRVKMPNGYTVPPHSHPTDEHVTIISGSLLVGMGSKLDESAMKTLGAGGYASMPARSNHYVRAKGETILQVNGTGPFEVKYVDPKDDPRKKTTTASK